MPAFQSTRNVCIGLARAARSAGTTLDTSANFLTPHAVVGVPSFTHIAAGFFNTCATTAARTAWCWGLNGLLGTGSGFGQPQPVPTPVAVLGSRVFTEISTGGAHPCARAADGTWCWGSSGNGRLGNGVATSGVTQFVAPVKAVFP